jgi:predicted GTPase
MVGFLGTSGAGKSSLINEILGEKILPHSEEQASTAVAVEISYHSLDDPESQYRASIEGISTTEFREELEQLYEDKLLWEEGPDGEDGEDDEEDLEVLQRIEVTMSKISCLIPHIQTIRDLENTSIDDILASEVCQSMLDRVTVWKCHDAVLFARYIKGYIDTSMSQDGEIAEFSVWPLVKVVKLQLRSNILKNGIVLVDLPGSHDTSAARVKVADEYQKKLAVTCVVAPTTRAASDKIAHDLLSNDKRRTMQLDGKYNSDSLYFVITKIDDLIDVSSYIRDHPNLRKSLSEEVSERDKLKQEIKKLRGDISKGRAANVKKNIPALQSLRNRIKDIEPHVEEIWNSLTKYYQQRKRSLDDIESKSQIVILVYFY